MINKTTILANGRPFMFRKEIDISVAQIKALYTIPLEIIPAIPGFLIVPTDCLVNFTKGSNNYSDKLDTSGSDIMAALTWGNTTSGLQMAELGYIIAKFSGGAAVNDSAFNRVSVPNEMITGFNKGIYLLSGTSDLSGSTGDGTLQLIITYTIVKI
jgi:hypothetical protein